MQYTLLEVDAGQLAVEFVEVSYDFETTAREIEEFGLPEEFAEIIRTGRA